MSPTCGRPPRSKSSKFLDQRSTASTSLDVKEEPQGQDAPQSSKVKPADTQEHDAQHIINGKTAEPPQHSSPQSSIAEEEPKGVHAKQEHFSPERYRQKSDIGNSDESADSSSADATSET